MRIIFLLFLIGSASWPPVSLTGQDEQTTSDDAAVTRPNDSDPNPEPLDVDTRRELFVDHFLIDRMQGASLRLHHPRKASGQLPFDKPWEGAFAGYATLIKDGDIYRMYYRGLPVAGADGSDKEVTCYAVSLDGEHWHKPDLGIYTLGDSSENNIVLMGHSPASHNFAPFLDSNPHARIDQRYKALGGGAQGLLAFTSPDGIHWQRLQEDPVFTRGIFDSQNVSFWSESEQQYVCYFRTWTGDGYRGVRTISRTTSVDFINWSEPQSMSFGDTPMEHLYTNQTSPYFRAPHLYVAMAARFMPGRRVLSATQADQVGVNPRYFNDCSDSVLMTSRGGYQYDRTFMESFVRPGLGAENWVSRSNYVANGIVPTSPSEMSIYMSRNYGQPTAFLQRYVLRTDGFASIHAGYAGGTVLTNPLTFSHPSELELQAKRKRWNDRIQSMSERISPRVVKDSIYGQRSLKISQPVSIELPETQTLGNQFTLAAHLKNIPAGQRRLFSAYNGGSTVPGELVLDFDAAANIGDDGAIRFYWNDFTLTADIEDIERWNREAGDDSAHHIAVTWFEGLAKLFFDGQVIASGQYSGDSSVSLTLGNLRLAEDIAPTSLVNEPLLGLVDDILVLKQTLSDDQIAVLARDGAESLFRGGDETDRQGILLTMEDDETEQQYDENPLERMLNNSLSGPAVTLATLPAVEFPGRQLEINVSTSAAGSLRVAVCDAHGDPFEGFSLDDCDVIIGDEIAKTVSWRGGQSDLSRFCETPIRLQFELKDADVYSLRFK